MKIKRNLLYFFNILIYLCFASYIGSFIISTFYVSQEINIAFKVVLAALAALIIAVCYIIGNAVQELDAIQELYKSEDHIHIWEIVIVLSFMIVSVCISVIFFGTRFQMSGLASVIFGVLMIPAAYFAGRILQDIMTGVLASAFCMILPAGAFAGWNGFLFGQDEGFFASCIRGIYSLTDGEILMNILSRVESITIFTSPLPKLVMCLFFFFSIWAGLFLFMSQKNGGVFLTLYFNLVVVLQILFDFSDYFYLIIYPAAAMTAAMGISFFIHKWMFVEREEDGYDDMTEYSFENFQIVSEDDMDSAAVKENAEEQADSMERQPIPLKNSAMDEDNIEIPEDTNEPSERLSLKATEKDNDKENTQESSELLDNIEKKVLENALVHKEEKNMLLEESRLLDEEEALLFSSREQDEEEAEFFKELENSAKESKQLREQVQQAEDELMELTEKYQKQKVQLKELIQLLEQTKEHQKTNTEELDNEKQKVQTLEETVERLHQDVEEQKQQGEGYRKEAETFRLAAEKNRARAEKLKEDVKTARKEMAAIKEESSRYRKEAEMFRQKSEEYRQENTLLLGKMDDLREQLRLSEQDNSKEELEHLKEENEKLEKEYQCELIKLQEEKTTLEQKYQEELQKRRELLRRAKEEISRIRNQK